MTADENPLIGVVTRALQDDAFRERLVADPAATLAAEGVALPEGVTVKVIEDTESVRHLVLPAAARALADEELDWVAAAEKVVLRIDPTTPPPIQ